MPQGCHTFIGTICPAQVDVVPVLTGAEVVLGRRSGRERLVDRADGRARLDPSVEADPEPRWTSRDTVTVAVRSRLRWWRRCRSAPVAVAVVADQVRQRLRIAPLSLIR